MNIISRSDWGARPPKSVKQIAVPTRELWLHHTAGSGHTGAAAVRAIQRFHMDTRGWSDIAYSFLVDATGAVYEGRGPAVAGAHTRDRNSISHGLCAMGDYQQEQPTERLVASIAQLVRHGHERGWWPDRLTGGHRDVGQTACPGQYLYSRIPEINRWTVDRDAASKEKHMKRGDSGQRVLALQARLTWWRDEQLAWDGQYGPSTEAAVKRFQQQQGITEDGVWTDTEWALLVVNAISNGHISGGTGATHTHDFAAKNHYHDFQTTTKGATGKARP